MKYSPSDVTLLKPDVEDENVPDKTSDVKPFILKGRRTWLKSTTVVLTSMLMSLYKMVCTDLPIKWRSHSSANLIKWEVCVKNVFCHLKNNEMKIQKVIQTLNPSSLDVVQLLWMYCPTFFKSNYFLFYFLSSTRHSALPIG